MIVKGPALDIPHISLFQMLENTVQRQPQRVAVRFAGTELTYRQLDESVRVAMAALQEAGVRMGDRVGIMLPNCPQYVIAYYAISGLGALVVQINPMSQVPELHYLLQNSGAQMVIAYGPLVPLVQKVRTEIGIEKVVGVSLLPAERQTVSPDVWFDEWLIETAKAGDALTNLSIPRYNPDDTVAVLQYTGGTTGRPKGAMLTHTNLVANAYQTRALIPAGNEETDVMVAALPLFHVFAMTVCMNYPIAAGITIRMVARFDAHEMLTILAEEHPTIFPGVPTMYLALTQVLPPGSTALQSLRVCISGGAPMPEQVLHNFENASGAVVLEGYGLTESSPVTHVNPAAERRRVGSIGLVAHNTDARVVSLHNPEQTLPVGERGELAIRGPQVMKGYWQKPQETAEVLVDGWLLTGDIATLDKDEYFYIVDRKKDMIIASGFNVYPREVEETLYQHPEVLEVAVVGVPDEYRGETVKAFVVRRTGHQDLTAEQLQTWCRERLAAYKIPRVIEFRDELPKSSVGKVLRRELRD